MSLPGSEDCANGKALGEGSWRTVLLKRDNAGYISILAESEVFTILGPDDTVGFETDPSAIVKTDRYIYAEEAVVSIYVSTTSKEDQTEVGFLPANFSENEDRNVSYQDPITLKSLRK